MGDGQGEFAEERHNAVSHPRHYTQHPSGVECIEVTRWMSFNRGNVVKYVWRAGEKGDELEDLRKAAWYLADEIRRVEFMRNKERGDDAR